MKLDVNPVPLREYVIGVITHAAVGVGGTDVTP